MLEGLQENGIWYFLNKCLTQITVFSNFHNQEILINQMNKVELTPIISIILDLLEKLLEKYKFINIPSLYRFYKYISLIAFL